MLLRHRLQPYCLPYAAGGSVPHTAALYALLSEPVAEAEVVYDPYFKEVCSAFYGLGYVAGTGEIAVFASADLAAVYPYAALAHNCAEVQDYPFAAPRIWNGKFSAVDYLVTGHRRSLNAGEQAFEREGNDCLLAFFGEGHIPFAVQA